jgi:hypothetical protein
VKFSGGVSYLKDTVEIKYTFIGESYTEQQLLQQMLNEFVADLEERCHALDDEESTVNDEELPGKGEGVRREDR